MPLSCTLLTALLLQAGTQEAVPRQDAARPARAERTLEHFSHLGSPMDPTRELFGAGLALGGDADGTFGGDVFVYCEPVRAATAHFTGD